MSKLHIKTGDEVIVVSGNSKGVKGKVLEVSPKEGKVIVEKANVVSKHVKPRKQGEHGNIVEVESAMYACKVQLLCSKCGPTRVNYKLEKDKDGKTTKTRVCAKCGAEI